MVFKHHHKPELSTFEILGKYKKGGNPFANPVRTPYNDRHNPPRVLAKYLESDAQHLEAVLEANEGKKAGANYKAVNDANNYATYDLRQATESFNAITSKIKAIKQKGGEINDELGSNLNVAKKALDECQERYDKVSSFKTYIDEMKENSLDPDTRKQFISTIKNLKKLAHKIDNLCREGDRLHQNYREFWGKSEDIIDPKKIDEKEIKRFEKMVYKVKELCKSMPKQDEVLNEHLNSVKSSQMTPRINQ
jgi:chromosome segregation ATPase